MKNKRRLLSITTGPSEITNQLGVNRSCSSNTLLWYIIEAKPTGDRYPIAYSPVTAISGVFLIGGYQSYH